MARIGTTGCKIVADPDGNNRKRIPPFYLWSIVGLVIACILLYPASASDEEETKPIDNTIKGNSDPSVQENDHDTNDPSLAPENTASTQEQSSENGTSDVHKKGSKPDSLSTPVNNIINSSDLKDGRQTYNRTLKVRDTISVKAGWYNPDLDGYWANDSYAFEGEAPKGGILSTDPSNVYVTQRILFYSIGDHLIALNPIPESLSIPKGTKLRVLNHIKVSSHEKPDEKGHEVFVIAEIIEIK